MAAVYIRIHTGTHVKNAIVKKKLCGQFPPCRGGPGMKRITIPEQRLKFIGFKTPAKRGLLLGPPIEPPFGKAFLTQPESLTVIAQDFDGCPPPVDKYKQISGKRI
jgi:hypothetical protein